MSKTNSNFNLTIITVFWNSYFIYNFLECICPTNVYVYYVRTILHTIRLLKWLLTLCQNQCDLLIVLKWGLFSSTDIRFFQGLIFSSVFYPLLTVKETCPPCNSVLNFYGWAFSIALILLILSKLARCNHILLPLFGLYSVSLVDLSCDHFCVVSWISIISIPSPGPFFLHVSLVSSGFHEHHNTLFSYVLLSLFLT